MKTLMRFLVAFVLLYLFLYVRAEAQDDSTTIIECGDSCLSLIIEDEDVCAPFMSTNWELRWVYDEDTNTWQEFWVVVVGVKDCGDDDYEVYVPPDDRLDHSQNTAAIYVEEYGVTVYGIDQSTGAGVLDGIIDETTLSGTTFSDGQVSFWVLEDTNEYQINIIAPDGKLITIISQNLEFTEDVEVYEDGL